MKYAAAFRKKFGALGTFTVRDASVFLTRLGASSGYVRLLLHDLAKMGELKRITRGAYTFADESDAVGQAFSPYYYGLQDALSIHGLWEQETNPVVITPRMVRPGIRQFLGANYLVRRISRRMFFGYGPVLHAGKWVNASDVEKTLVDYAYYNAPLPPESLEEIKRRLDKKKLDSYLKRCSPRTTKKVRAWLKAQIGKK